VAVELHAGIFGSTNQNPSDFERHRGFVDGRLTSGSCGDGGAIAAGILGAPRLAFLRELPQLARHRPPPGYYAPVYAHRPRPAALLVPAEEV